MKQNVYVRLGLLQAQVRDSLIQLEQGRGCRSRLHLVAKLSLTFCDECLKDHQKDDPQEELESASKCSKNLTEEHLWKWS